ncbi:MAG: hypothetical protein ACR2NU_09665 [Aeoliella sp.]
MNASAKSWLPRVSLREFLGIVTFVAVACAAMRYASPLWDSILSIVVILIGTATTIIACVERGKQQAFTIGFAACLIGYSVAWSLEEPPKMVYEPISGNENYIRTGKSPLTKFLSEGWMALRAPYYVTTKTNQAMERYDGPITDVALVRMGRANIPPPKNLSNWPKSAGTVYHLTIRPRLDTFTAIGHALFALLFGYLGGKFAVFVYHRRLSRENSTEHVATTAAD